MKISITAVDDAAPTAPFVLRGNYSDSIRSAAKIGFEAVELHLSDPAHLAVDDVLRTKQAAGVSVSSIGTGMAFIREGITLTHADPAIRQRALQRMLDFVRLSAKVGGVVIVGLIKGTVKESGNREAYDKSFSAALDQLLDLASQLDVNLVIEAVNRYESDILNTIEEMATFTRRFQTPRLKVHIDTFHMNMEEVDFSACIEAAEGHIGHVHIADSNRRYPGQGHFRFDPVLQALQRIDYRGALAVECIPWPSSEEAAREACTYLKARVRPQVAA
jgi:sugar phosphate isomerase/epimerase